MNLVNIENINKPTKEEIRASLEKRHDLKKDVWFLRQAGEKSHEATSTALISLRAEESLDRRVILSQGEYSTGQYSRNNGVNICSPVFDYTVKDIWRLIATADWDINDVYEKLYEIGVSPAQQRVGSLLNYAAVRSISTVKALEPALYGRINGRFQNVEFMSQFSRAGYFRIGKPKDTSWDGHNHMKAGFEDNETKAVSDKYEEILMAFSIPYERYNENEFRSTDEKFKGKPWFPFKMIGKIWENNSDEEKKDILSLLDGELDFSLGIIHTTWRDYSLMLLNSTPDPLRSIWREKVATSFSHWNFINGSISEGNLSGLEILTVLPSELTKSVVDDVFEHNLWKKISRLTGSKRMKVFLGHYPQESLSNEANLCLKYVVKNWDKCGHLIQETDLLKRIWDFAQASGGKCILPDEMLTYTLEKPINDKIYGAWIEPAYDIFTNGIPSDKYVDYWKSGKMEGFPLAEEEGKGRYVSRIIYENKDGSKAIVLGDEIPLEEQKKNFLKVCDVMFKEDIPFSPAWKKIAICILKNDTSFKYAGFGATLRERVAREDALAAFSTKEEDKKKAKVEALRLAKQIEKEKLSTK